METSQFIFSDKYRLERHILFWFSWWLFCSFLYSFTPAPLPPAFKTRLLISSLEAVVFLVAHVFLSYSLMYFVVPKLLFKSRYLLTALSVVILFLLTGAISGALSIYFLPGLRQYILPADINKAYRVPVKSAFYMALLAGLRGAITIGGLAASIKIMKHWYIKEQRNMQLQKENIQSQLQLLKAQVHPHFLFNTLNNIYSYTQNTSPVASQLVMGLSDMLRCILYECNRPLISLNKELKMLQDFILLEKIRYGNKLDVNIDVPKDVDEFEIAPLLLLPFVENSFKHGASQMIEQPWISLSITIDDGSMRLKLVNGKAENYHAPIDSAGIGIQNVRRRLELLYPSKHTLKIQDLEEVFIVDLTLELDRKPLTTTQIVNPEKTVVYE
ncbi:MAG: histidine kinase [Segetibacter sp.]